MIDRSNSRYEILEDLGSCGMGIAYQGEDRWLARCTAGSYLVRRLAFAAYLFRRLSYLR
jgi:hypothetical protein